MFSREISWLECLWTRVTSSPHSIQTCDVSSALTSRGRSLSLQPPRSTLISSAYSALLSNFLLKACLPGNVNHSDRFFFFLGLCNTLIYTLCLFFHMGPCVWKMKRPDPHSWPKIILLSVNSAGCFSLTGRNCASAWFLTEHEISWVIWPQDQSVLHHQSAGSSLTDKAITLWALWQSLNSR